MPMPVYCKIILYTYWTHRRYTYIRRLWIGHYRFYIIVYGRAEILHQHLLRARSEGSVNVTYDKTPENNDFNLNRPGPRFRVSTLISSFSH